MLLELFSVAFATALLFTIVLVGAAGDVRYLRQALKGAQHPCDSFERMLRQIRPPKPPPLSPPTFCGAAGKSKEVLEVMSGAQCPVWCPSGSCSTCCLAHHEIYFPQTKQSSSKGIDVQESLLQWEVVEKSKNSSENETDVYSESWEEPKIFCECNPSRLNVVVAESFRNEGDCPALNETILEEEIEDTPKLSKKYCTFVKEVAEKEDNLPQKKHSCRKLLCCQVEKEEEKWYELPLQNTKPAVEKERCLVSMDLRHHNTMTVQPIPMEYALLAEEEVLPETRQQRCTCSSSPNTSRRLLAVDAYKRSLIKHLTTTSTTPSSAEGSPKREF